MCVCVCVCALLLKIHKLLSDIWQCQSRAGVNESSVRLLTDLMGQKTKHFDVISIEMRQAGVMPALTNEMS